MKKFLIYCFACIVLSISVSESSPTWKSVSPSEAALLHLSPDGFESTTNTYLFLCRAIADGDRYLAGKLYLGAGEAKCLIEVHDAVSSFNAFEMLIAEPGTTAWVPIKEGKVPPYAIPASKHRDGEDSYACRARVSSDVDASDSLIVGGWGQGDNATCYIVYDGRAITSQTGAEILALSGLGQLLKEQ